MSQGNAAATSYDEVTRQRKGDWSSQQVAFRHFNNFVKKSLIQFALDRVAANTSASPAVGAAVLDLGSGRGGDIGKWFFMRSPAQGNPQAPASVLHTTVYDCYDVSTECISEAEQRCKEMAATADRPPRCSASFTVADCFAEPFLRETLPRSPRFGRYNVVTIQFAFHYACKSVELIRSVLAAIADALAPGGVVLITTVDIAALSARAAADELCGDLYRITFPDPPQFTSAADGAAVLATGTEYHFHLEGFVDCTEYVVPYETVVQAAAEVQLRLCPSVSKPFADMVREYSVNWRVNKGNKLSAAELALVTLYRAICFEKVAESAS